MDAIGIIVVGALLALIPASIARNKGLSFGGYYALSLLCFPLALIIVVAKKPKA